MNKENTNRVFVFENENWVKHIPDLEDFASSILEATERKLEAEDVENYEYGVVFGDDDMVQFLNRDYRHMDKPTNVLSFENEPGKNGDIILALETIQRESSEQNKSLKDHLAHLLIHGRLHLAGYDHIEDDDADCMESLESEIMVQLGYSDPWKNNPAHLT